MQFHTPVTMYQKLDINRKRISPFEFYKQLGGPEEEQEKGPPATGSIIATGRKLALTEGVWYDELRPYYKIWPAVLKALQRFPIDVPLNSLKLPYLTVALRLPVGYEIPVRLTRARMDGVLLSPRSCTLSCIILSHKLQLAEFKNEKWFKHPSLMVRCFYLDCETTTSGLRTDWKTTLSDQYMDVDHKIMSLIINVLMLSKDPSFIEPEVLNKDRDKYEATKDQKYVDKARRRGVVGWNIGRVFESIPHYRRPHLGLRWTGKGGKIPKIVPIKATIVHRDKMKKVPTGYITPDGVEVEP